MGDHVRVYEQRTVQSKLRNERYEIPVFSYPETLAGVSVSSRWSPQFNLLITGIEVSCSINTGGLARFYVLKGSNNKAIDFSNPFDVLLLGGEVMGSALNLPSDKTQYLWSVTYPLATSEWLAVSHYEDTCSAQSPSIRFHSQIERS